MAYAVQADIEAIYGTKNVARWSNLDSDSTTVNATRTAAAIAWASATVDDRFRRSAYTVPFVALLGTYPQSFVDIVAKLAGVWLYNSRGLRDAGAGEEGNRITAHRREAEELMDLYHSGSRVWSMQSSETDPRDAPMVV